MPTGKCQGTRSSPWANFRICLLTIRVFTGPLGGFAFTFSLQRGIKARGQFRRGNHANGTVDLKPRVLKVFDFSNAFIFLLDDFYTKEYLIFIPKCVVDFFGA